MRQAKDFRILLIGGLFALFGILIIGQMIRIQTNENAQKLKEYSDENYTYDERIITPERGSIYDRKGLLLAGNVQVYEVGIALNEVTNNNLDFVVGELVRILDISRDNVDAILAKAPPNSYQVVADFVSPEKIIALEAQIKEYKNLPAPKKRNEVRPNLNGIHFLPHLQRSYPEGSLAVNILGYYPYYNTKEGTGTYGIEQKYNQLLSGTPIKVVLPVNPNDIKEIPSVPPGSSLILTIDREIQAAMERIADKAMEDTGAESATILVADPETGEILAMANTPRMNPNTYWDHDNTYPKAYMFNRAISQTYEPGSVFKVLTMAAALDAGAVAPDTSFLDTGVIEIGGIYIYNWDRGAWGPQDMTGCMQHSLNVCLAWIAEQLGPTKFYEYIQKFGIGHRTNIDLAGEELWPLSLPGDEWWTPVNLGTNSFGQGLATTPIQMITAISAVANDGKIMTPHIVKGYIDDGRQIDIQPTVLSTPIKPETARTLTDMLAVSLENEASSALVPGYRVAGKTGTGQIATDDGYTSSLTNASFVGWGPADDPKFIVYIWLEKPTTAPWGSVVAAPVFSEAVKELVVLMDLPPDEVRMQLASQ